jgi:hypothetical protein
VQFSASSRKSRNCSEANSCKPHKRFHRLVRLRCRFVRLGRDLLAFGVTCPPSA